jgi:ubiquinone/menaquinone biosynthesis C-methylase UbiE
MVLGMNGGHAKLADWGMSHLENITPASIAELGCGGGRNAAELLKRYPAAKLTALDYAEASVRKTKATNKKAIAAGRCTVLRENVASLPFDGASFDLATAFETVYFWPGIETCFAEVCRILKPGGTFLICNESDGTDETGLKFEKIIDGMKNHTAEEIEKALKAAGFSEVRCYHHSSKPWITVLAKK